MKTSSTAKSILIFKSQIRMNIIIMGVSGCGKSTIARLLAKSLKAAYHDGDDFHPQSNIDKMASGTPLTDADRQPWLETLAKLMHDAPSTTVLACSALKKAYRDTLRSAGDVTFVYLHGSKETLLERLTKRSNNSNHFMPSSLLDSQLATLENPSEEPDTITVSITDSPPQIITNIFSKL